MMYMKIKTMAVAVIAAVLLSGCGEPKTNAPARFTDEVRLGMTPVKDQGASSVCWAYAMLATIETEHIMRGDSVNLSPDFVARAAIVEQADRCYLSQGKCRIKTRGMMPQLVRLIQTYGLMPYDSYHTTANITVAARKAEHAVTAAARQGKGLAAARRTAEAVIDQSMGPLPWHVYMYSMEYTPLEFAHSVCMPDEYEAFTSFTHLPMSKRSVLDVPDNYGGYTFYNMPIDKLMALMEKSLRDGHPVCWEGDTSERGFSFQKGVADVGEARRATTQEQRQREFETFRTTDDHCMAIVGLAHDAAGRKYFICKNSWGKENPYSGLMYMSFDYARLKTVAVMVNRYATENKTPIPL